MVKFETGNSGDSRVTGDSRVWGNEHPGRGKILQAIENFEFAFQNRIQAIVNIVELASVSDANKVSMWRDLRLCGALLDNLDERFSEDASNAELNLDAQAILEAPLSPSAPTPKKGAKSKAKPKGSAAKPKHTAKKGAPKRLKKEQKPPLQKDMQPQVDSHAVFGNIESVVATVNGKEDFNTAARRMIEEAMFMKVHALWALASMSDVGPNKLPMWQNKRLRTILLDVFESSSSTHTPSLALFAMCIVKNFCAEPGIQTELWSEPIFRRGLLEAAALPNINLLELRLNAVGALKSLSYGVLKETMWQDLPTQEVLLTNAKSAPPRELLDTLSAPRLSDGSPHGRPRRAGGLEHSVEQGMAAVQIWSQALGALCNLAVVKENMMRMWDNMHVRNALLDGPHSSFLGHESLLQEARSSALSGLCNLASAAELRQFLWEDPRLRSALVRGLETDLRSALIASRTLFRLSSSSPILPTIWQESTLRARLIASASRLKSSLGFGATLAGLLCNLASIPEVAEQMWKESQLSSCLACLLSTSLKHQPTDRKNVGSDQEDEPLLAVEVGLPLRVVVLQRTLNCIASLAAVDDNKVDMWNDVTLRDLVWRCRSMDVFKLGDQTFESSANALGLRAQLGCILMSLTSHPEVRRSLGGNMEARETLIALLTQTYPMGKPLQVALTSVRGLPHDSATDKVAQHKKTAQRPRPEKKATTREEVDRRSRSHSGASRPSVPFGLSSDQDLLDSNLPVRCVIEVGGRNVAEISGCQPIGGFFFVDKAIFLNGFQFGDVVTLKFHHGDAAESVACISFSSNQLVPSGVSGEWELTLFNDSLENSMKIGIGKQKTVMESHNRDAALVFEEARPPLAPAFVTLALEAPKDDPRWRAMCQEIIQKAESWLLPRRVEVVCDNPAKDFGIIKGCSLACKVLGKDEKAASFMVLCSEANLTGGSHDDWHYMAQVPLSFGDALEFHMFEPGGGLAAKSCHKVGRVVFPGFDILKSYAEDFRGTLEIFRRKENGEPVGTLVSITIREIGPFVDGQDATEFLRAARHNIEREGLGYDRGNHRNRAQASDMDVGGVTEVDELTDHAVHLADVELGGEVALRGLGGTNVGRVAIRHPEPWRQQGKDIVMCRTSAFVALHRLTEDRDVCLALLRHKVGGQCPILDICAFCADPIPSASRVTYRLKMLSLEILVRLLSDPNIASEVWSNEPVREAILRASHPCEAVHVRSQGLMALAYLAGAQATSLSICMHEEARGFLILAALAAKDKHVGSLESTANATIALSRMVLLNSQLLVSFWRDLDMRAGVFVGAAFGSSLFGVETANALVMFSEKDELQTFEDRNFRRAVLKICTNSTLSKEIRRSCLKLLRSAVDHFKLQEYFCNDSSIIMALARLAGDVDVEIQEIGIAALLALASSPWRRKLWRAYGPQDVLLLHICSDAGQQARDFALSAWYHLARSPEFKEWLWKPATEHEIIHELRPGHSASPSAKSAILVWCQFALDPVLVVPLWKKPGVRFALLNSADERTSPSEFLRYRAFEALRRVGEKPANQEDMWKEVRFRVVFAQALYAKQVCNDEPWPAPNDMRSNALLILSYSLSQIESPSLSHEATFGTKDRLRHALWLENHIREFVLEAARSAPGKVLSLVEARRIAFSILSDFARCQENQVLMWKQNSCINIILATWRESERNPTHDKRVKDCCETVLRRLLGDPKVKEEANAIAEMRDVIEQLSPSRGMESPQKSNGGENSAVSPDKVKNKSEATTTIIQCSLDEALKLYDLPGQLDYEGPLLSDLAKKLHYPVASMLHSAKRCPESSSTLWPGRGLVDFQLHVKRKVRRDKDTNEPHADAVSPIVQVGVVGDVDNASQLIDVKSREEIVAEDQHIDESKGNAETETSGNPKASRKESIAEVKAKAPVARPKQASVRGSIRPGGGPKVAALRGSLRPGAPPLKAGPLSLGVLPKAKAGIPGGSVAPLAGEGLQTKGSAHTHKDTGNSGVALNAELQQNTPESSEQAPPPKHELSFEEQLMERLKAAISVSKQSLEVHVEGPPKEADAEHRGQQGDQSDDGERMSGKMNSPDAAFTV